MVSRYLVLFTKKFPCEAFDTIPLDGVAHLFADCNTQAAAIAFIQCIQKNKMPILDFLTKI